jgi:hypothetical protein
MARKCCLVCQTLRPRQRESNDPKDLVEANMWFLIAGEQITRAKNHVNKTMTMKELLKAEHGA